MPDPSNPPLPEIPAHRRQGGIFITTGSRVEIPVGGLRINLNDQSIDGSVTLHMGLDTCPVWAAIAVKHLVEAKSCRERVLAAWHGTDDNLLGNELISEFTAGVQATTAAAIAIDAFYAQVKEYAPPPAEEVQRWSQNRTARYKQVAELLRRAFHISPRNAVQLRKVLKTVYQLRDWSVHPPAGAQATTFHPELHFGTEWRFVAFAYPNAIQAVRASLSLSWQAANKPNLSSSRLQEYCGGLRTLLAPVVAEWEPMFGSLSPPVPPPLGQTA